MDGEGWDGRYTLLACSAHVYDLYNPDGLPTRACLRYLTDWGVRGNDALVGFGLSYDFENILRDVPDDDYKKLLEGEGVQFHEFTLKYIPRKILEIKRDLDKVDDKGKKRFKTVFLQDSMGYFQTSFEKALTKFKIEIPPIITEGKALRGDFRNVPLKFIKDYNRTELKLHVQMMEILRDSSKEAFEAIGLKSQATPRTWFGPGAWASSFLKQTDWIYEHPAFRGPAVETLQSELKTYISPFISTRLPKEYDELTREIDEASLYIKSIEDSFFEGLKTLHSPDDLKARIKQMGGIRPSKDLWEEEYQTIPRDVKRVKGRPLDEIADELRLSARDLIDKLTARTSQRSTQSLKREAISLANIDPEYRYLSKTITKLTEERAKLVETLTPDSLAYLENLHDHPFAAAFYGGRIEAAAVGEFDEWTYDYDINSAYPFALANFPRWEPGDLQRVESLDPSSRIGMYYVEWSCPQGSGFYPFPYRSQTGNVFYPARGKGWYMSPEVYAALEVWGPVVISVKQGYVLDGTEGAGDGLHRLPEHKLCETSKKMDLMAKIRLKAKAEGLSMENALKLLMNSCYGKTVQQVGSHKYLNMLAASWITSTCRAIIARTIGNDTENATISVMTDGILTRKPLDVKLGKALGEFDLTSFDKVIQFMPGVYHLENSETGKKVSKYRGMDKNFAPVKAKSILWTEDKKYKDPLGEKQGPPMEGERTPAGEIKVNYYPVNINIFVTRNLALHQPNKYDPYRYQFMPVTKLEEFSLRSKRTPGKKGFRLLKKEKHHFFPPKDANPMELFVGGSKPYVLDFPRENDPDEATEEEEMMEEQRMAVLLEMEHYDLRG